MYAIEIPELVEVLPKQDADDDFEFKRRGFPRPVLYLLLLGITMGGFGLMAYFANQFPDADSKLLGEGGRLAYTELLATKAASLRETPDAKGKPVAAVAKDEILDLLAKRDRFYRARNKAGDEGWINIEEVVAMYEFGGKEIQEQYDPLYNPDQYVLLENASWLMLEAEGNDVTQFSFMLGNSSKYVMTDLVLEALLKIPREPYWTQRVGILEPDSTALSALNPDEKDVKAATRAGEEPPEPKLIPRPNRWSKKMKNCTTVGLLR